MIAFFRKIRRKLLGENRVSKYLTYAIGEIFLVVIGILIALQINNWNENRKEKKEEVKILKSLKTEYTYNREELNRNIKKAERIYQNSDTLLKVFFSDTKTTNVEHIQKWVNVLKSYPTFDPSNGALNDLIGSGRLKLIQNDSLRFRLSQWFGMLQDVKEDEQRLMSFGDQYLLPIELDLFTYAKNSRFNSEAPKIFERKDIENIIVTINHRADYLLDPNYSMMQKEIDEILLKIEEELDNIN